MRSKRYGNLERIARKTSDRCHLCGEDLDLLDYGAHRIFGGDIPTVDHLLPQAFGGDDDDDDDDNLLLAHGSCNSSRGTKPAWETRMQKRGVPWAPMSPAGRCLFTVATAAAGAEIGGRIGGKRLPDGSIESSQEGATLGLLAGLVLGVALS